MEQTSAPRMHPLIKGAAGSVIAVSLLGVAAITGVLPTSRGNENAITPYNQGAVVATPVTAVQASAPSRYVTADGQILEVVPRTQNVSAAQFNDTPARAPVRHRYASAPVRHQTIVHHTYEAQGRTPRYQQADYAQQHPVRSYVSDMHPVGTGIGAVVGGLIGNQIGGGDGKKLATAAGVMLAACRT